MMNKHVIGYTGAVVVAVLIGAGIGTAAGSGAPADCLKALDSADANFKVLGGAMTSASKVVAAATSGSDAGVQSGVAEINVAGSKMTLGEYRTARDACRTAK